MFYMFSGPDFLYANAFYSKASTYVLSALEPVGSVPDLSRLPRGGIASALYNVERSLGSILSFSFFITKDMKTDLQAGQISGTLPILYVFLARSGMTVKSVSPISLDDQGAAYFAGENAGPNAVRGVRIMFAGSDGQEKTLYYFSTDLSNSGVKASGFLKFCATLAPGNSLIKSASYLLHSGNFTTVRDFLLNNSATIIQDDSGIPLAYYSTKKWRFFPFGRYLGPIDEFPGRYQDSYAALFRRAQPIDFGIGYRWRTPEIECAAVGEIARRRFGRHRRHVVDRNSAAATVTAASAKAATAGGCRTAAARRWLLLLAVRAESSLATGFASSAVDAAPASVAPRQIPSRTRRRSSAARCRCRMCPRAGSAVSAPASSIRRPTGRSVRSLRRHTPSRSADAGSCSRPAATACAGRSRSARDPHCAADDGRCWHNPCNAFEVTMKDLRAPCWTMYVILRVFQAEELNACRYLRHSSQLSHRRSGGARQGIMDDTGQYSYRFSDASMTESFRVEVGPLPSLPEGAWGKEPN